MNDFFVAGVADFFRSSTILATSASRALPSSGPAYAHLSPQMKRDAVRHLDRLLEENLGQQLGNGNVALLQRAGKK